MATNCSAESLPICCAGSGGGTFLSPFVGYDSSPPALMTIVYMALLLWLFLGVALAADVFMAGIEQITSTLKYVKHVTKDGTIKRFRVRTWNPTVANLTLMALGSSAPEILLSTIELMTEDTNGLYTGELGPSTIVGSAAFNLFVIIAVCVIAIPADQKRKIVQPKVYAITATFSVVAYVWMVVVLQLVTPNMVTVEEAVITLLLFPLVVWLSFIADKWAEPRFRQKWLSRMGMAKAEDLSSSGLLPSEMLLEVKRPDGTPLEGDELMTMIKRLRRTTSGLAMDEEKAVQQVYKQVAAQQPKSRAYYRVNATRMITNGPKVDAEALPAPMAKGMSRAKVAIEEPHLELPKIAPGHSVLEFAADHYAIIEAAGSVTVQIARLGATDTEVTVRYTTVDGTAKGGQEAGKCDYEFSAGELTFKPGQLSHDLTIKVFDDDEIEPDEQFEIELLEVTKGEGSVGECKKTLVTIINDDFPGTLTLAHEEFKVKENCGVCAIQVDRVQGCSGEISMAWHTTDGTALAGKNYEKAEGTLSWSHQEVGSKFIHVPIVDDDVMQGNLYFEVELHSATGGAHFDEKTDGSKEKSMARISIVDDDAVRSIAERAIGMLGMSQQNVRLGASSWKEQFTSALSPGGDDDEGGSVGVLAYVLHAFALPWKLLVAFVPPPSIAGGLPCFGAAIVVIGLMTAVIGDLANLLGCSMGLKSTIVAFTFVALGTSLPDTFASRSAAMGDPTADNAIGNVTGSNAVNVFLGSGVSWMLGAVYWTSRGYDPYWVKKYKTIAAQYDIAVQPDGSVVTGQGVIGLAVPAGALVPSVITFCICAILCIATLALRRHFLDAELGDKFRWPTAIFFVALWLVYVVVGIVAAMS